ncbi:MAG: hypothetical protein J6Q22_09460 [Prevotella sp.]|nr:hypothetical protein [Prevotella sp.]
MMLNMRELTAEEEQRILLAENITFRSPKMEKALHRWHNRNKRFCAEAEPDFRKWVLQSLEGIMRSCGKYATAQNVALAFRVVALGDEVANYLARKAKRHGYKADVNCYVEEEKVFANVWISGKSAEELAAREKEIAEEFRKAGYEVESGADEIEERIIMATKDLGKWLCQED